MWTPPPRTLVRTLLLFALAMTLTAVPASGAVPNGGFEAGLTGWDATRVSHGWGYDSAFSEPAECTVPQRDICVLTGDSFSASDGYEGTTAHTVSPVEGTKMVRLGGPFTSPSEAQAIESYRLQQTFTVDPNDTALDLSYNIFTWDYSGFDELLFRVTLSDEEGDVIAERELGSFGQGVSLKTTGWRSSGIDLAGYGGQQVTLRIQAGGTSDHLFGFWAYVDGGGGDLPQSPVGEPQHGEVPDTPNGDPVYVNEQVDPATGLWWLTIPSWQAAQFDDGCVPLPISLPIAAGAGVVSNVVLQLQTGGAPAAWPMVEGPPGVWGATIDCIQTGELFVEYDLTEDGQTQRFLIPLGGLALIDPQGVVYDKAEYDAARAGGASEEDARAAAAIQGASVRLQREVNGTFVNVLSGDPGIMPKINPQITGANGLYQWDVSPGSYRVVVTKTGYPTVTSDAVEIPPPVLDLHIPMVRTGGNTGGGGGGGQGGGDNPGTTPTPPGNGEPPPSVGPPITFNPPTQTPGQNPTPPAPCVGLTGAAQRKCQADRRLAAALKRCNKLAKSKRSACKTKARQRAVCERLATAKRKTCLARLNRQSRRSAGRR